MTEDERKDHQAWQRLYGSTAEDAAPYAQLDAKDFELTPGGIAKTGADAAAEARALLAEHVGGEDMLERALSGRGRPSLDARRPQGVSPNRQVRLGHELDNELTDYINKHHTNRSHVIRQALQAWLHHHTPRSRQETATS